MSKALLSAAILTLCGATAQANIIVLEAVNGNLYQQTVQSPCVFQNPSCQNGAFPAVSLQTGGAVTGYDELSLVYTGAQILSIIGAGNPLRLGIDINQASGQPAQTLVGFEMRKNGVVVDTYPGPTDVPAGNNGNGYADFLLSNFSSFAAGDTIRFRFVFSNANDGTENVFLIGGTGTPPPQVPEPSAWIMIGSGLVGLGFLRRKR